MENNDAKYGRTSIQKLKRKNRTIKRICKIKQYYTHD